MHKPLRKPNLSHSSLVDTSVNWSQFFGYLYCFICTCALFFLTPQEKINQQKAGIDQKNSTIELNVGEIRQIELPSNIKKDFEWPLHELDETIWDLGANYNQSLTNDNPAFTEAPNLKHWTLKTIQTGSSTVRIPYYQPWESKNMVDKNFFIGTIVKL